MALLVAVIFGYSLDAQIRPPRTPQALAEFVGLNPGLIAGDVIYEMNGSRIGTLEGLHTALDGKKAGAPIALLVERSGQLIYVSFELE